MKADENQINDVLVKLQDAGTDDDAIIVETLAVKAGFWWKCKRCHYVGIPSEKRNHAHGGKAGK